MALYLLLLTPFYRALHSICDTFKREVGMLRTKIALLHLDNGDVALNLNYFKEPRDEPAAEALLFTMMDVDDLSRVEN